MSRAAAAAVALALAACGHPRKVAAPGAAEPPKPRDQASRAEQGVPPEGERPRVPASPKALLADGAIRTIQEALAARGLLGRHRSGELDGPTTGAIREFQRDQDLAETGFPDRLTLQKLGIDPEEAYGKVREEVKGGGGEGNGAGKGGEGSAGGKGEGR
ncbi:MAG TPA: peptidoglycan-binding domain-containing protein [Anaeromyxobacter sp.]|nr:peptidoglycan-binding domain-containing protein [Anaeromyxobacter sp.]